MFTGIIENLGKVSTKKKGDKGLYLGIFSLKKNWKIKVGDSIAVNGVCLTVAQTRKKEMIFFCQNETLEVTQLNDLSLGDTVNLEQAMRLSDRLGGHWVQGHVDFTGKVQSQEKIGEGFRYWITLPPKKKKGIVLKGSITIDGISLTISRLKSHQFSVDIIPHTHQNTNIAYWEKGTRVNIETDIIGKYIEQYLKGFSSKEENPWTQQILNSH